MCTSKTTSPINDRASPSKIRRAAGSMDPSILPQALAGWTVQELDDMASHDGKSALHMAAWHGCLENVQLLLNMGCNVNVIATGDYSYGKTPIFFAATRCRDDIVQYLLQHANARVKIVNNKGQSVLSIASSHLSSETIQMIQCAEQEQAEQEWINFQETHSDGLEYGDLDPRFLMRPLVDTDVVTSLAVVNPTTKQSRRGSFARKNPHVAKELERRNEKAQWKREQRMKAKVLPPVPTAKQVAQQNEAWQSIETCIVQGNYENVVKWLLQVIQFEEQQRRSWIPAATARLQSVLLESSDDMVAAQLEHAMEEYLNSQNVDYTPRQVTLLQKWIHQVCKAPTVSDDERSYSDSLVGASNNKLRLQRNIVNLSIPPWSAACQAVEGLSQSMLQNRQRHDSQLTLPEPPTWVDTETHLCHLKETLRQLSLKSSPYIVALDTEWYTSEADEIHISTIQISTVMETDETKQISTWVVDLLPATEGSSDYRVMIQELLSWLFDDDSHVILLGFAFAHDITVLHSICDLPSTKCLDVQKLASHEMKRGKTTLPGLQACSAHFLSENGSYVLSKEEQCSDWAQRPLRDSQLEYAGLDAAVLLVLLAEIAKGNEAR